jgi:hypothetical protein
MSGVALPQRFSNMALSGESSANNPTHEGEIIMEAQMLFVDVNHHK